VTPVIYTYLDTLQQRLGKFSLVRPAPARPLPGGAPAD